MDRRLSVRSETGRLRRVIVHTPGSEVEAMRPSCAEEDLYNDIIPMDIVQTEHAELKGFLSKVAVVHELKDILAEALAEAEARSELSAALCELNDSAHRRDELADMAPAELARVVVEGLPARHTRMEHYLRGREYDLAPLPNMYFMRDAAMVYRDRSIASAMRFKVRTPEALIHRLIFTRHPDFKGAGRLFDGPALAAEGLSLEGGDFQAIGPNVVAIGVSERTSARAVDLIARAMADAFGEPFSVIAVELPVARATIHLDMAFTVIDRDACLVFEPVILGPRRARVARIDVAPGKEPKLRGEDSLLDALKGVGFDLKPILTGGKDPIRQEREQWMSGANSFAYGPGKIVVYQVNVRTVEALSAAGFEYMSARDVIAGKTDPMAPGRLVVGFDGVELARGGGGARCMTCPVEREDE